MAKGDFVNQLIETAKDSSDGIHAITVVEIGSGMALGSYSDGKLDPDIASAYNVEVVKAKLKAVNALGLKETIEDILITLNSQSHLIGCTASGTHMVYIAADKQKSNLAMLRAVLQKAVKDLQSNL